MKVLHVTWALITKSTLELSKKLSREGEFKRIIAIARGGLIPSALLAQYLDIRSIDTICVQTRKLDGTINQAEKPYVIKTTKDIIGIPTVVVDDIVDTGFTINHVKKILPHAHFATLFSKVEGIADTSVRQVEEDTWVQFPWETNDISKS